MFVEFHVKKIKNRLFYCAVAPQVTSGASQTRREKSICMHTKKTKTKQKPTNKMFLKRV